MQKNKKEQGSVAVIVAVCLSVLFGFTALTVDFGMMASSKQSMQNAADAAALAASADVGAKKTNLDATNTAYEYTSVNGFDHNDDDVLVNVQIQGNKVTVTVEKEMTMGFSAVLTGQKKRPVSARAVAEAISLFGGSPYALFAGQKIEEGGNIGIEINGNNTYINGNIHSNSNITMPHAILGDGVNATAVGNVNPSGSGWINNSIAIDMPNISSFDKTLNEMQELVEFSGSKSYGKDAFGELINEAVLKYKQQMGNSNTDYLTNGLFIYINGSLTFRGKSQSTYNPTFPVTVVVKGDIDLNGANLGGTNNTPICIMSEMGDITVNGGGAEFNGIIFAPSGDVTINGNDAVFSGSIIAQNIIKNGGKITVSYNENADDYLPLTKVHLID